MGQYKDNTILGQAFSMVRKTIKSPVQYFVLMESNKCRYILYKCGLVSLCSLGTLISLCRLRVYLETLHYEECNMQLHGPK